MQSIYDDQDMHKNLFEHNLYHLVSVFVYK